MKPKSPGNPQADPFGQRLAAEARASRPAFNADLHARLMAELPAVTVQPRRILHAPFSMLRAAALVALMFGCGAAALTLTKNSPSEQSFADLVTPQEKKSPIVVAVADTPRTADNSRRLLSLARVRPMKMLKRMFSAPKEATAPAVVQTPDSIETPQAGVASADLFSIRVISRAPFLDMQFNPQRATETPAPQN